MKTTLKNKLELGKTYPCGDRKGLYLGITEDGFHYFFTGTDEERTGDFKGVIIRDEYLEQQSNGALSGQFIQQHISPLSQLYGTIMDHLMEKAGLK